MLQGLTPMLRTTDLKGSVAFYTGVLGFECKALEPAWHWAALQRDGVEIMLSGLNAHEGDATARFTGSLYLRCDDVEAWWARLKDAVRVCYGLETFPYGMREFAIYDNNGYLLQFGQPVA
jgi:uncharacterized glyoxalase superfamily protein PhnB